MISAILKSAIVLAAAACIAALLRRRSAALRHTVWTAGLIGALAIPLCTIALPSWPLGIAGRASGLLLQASTWFEPVRRVAVGVWLAGASAGLLLMIYGAARLAWVALRSEPVENARWAALADAVRRDLDIRRPVRLLQNRSAPFLGTWGIFVPRVLLPSDAEIWPDDRVRMVLSHELAHIKRHDWFVQVLAEAARAIYWFNPVFWIAYNNLRRESEHACDDAVLRLGATGTRYAEELLAMTRALRSEKRFQSPILAMAQPSHLEQRLVALLNPSLNRLAATPWAVLVVAALAVALTLPLAVMRAPEAKPEMRAPEVRPEEVRLEAMPAATAPAPATPPAAPPAPATPVPAVAADRTETPAQPAAGAVETFVCNVTPSVRETRTVPMKTNSLGDGPWIMNDDRSIWVAAQPYTAGAEVNTVWMRPPGASLRVTGKRLDGDAPLLEVRPAGLYPTTYLAIGLVFPAPGCWEVTATAGDSTLTFVTKVRE